MRRRRERQRELSDALHASEQERTAASIEREHYERRLANAERRVQAVATGVDVSRIRRLP